MTERILFRLKKICAALFTFSFFSCGTTPLPQPEPVQEARMESDGDVVSVSVPVQKKKTFFSDVKKTDLDAVEIGSPQSLRIAYNSLHRSVDDEYSDTERSLVKVICAIMNLVWPSENGSYIAPEIRVPDQYSGAVDSARRGIYDLSTDSSDFLSLVLPSIALVTSSNVSEYYGRAEESLQKALSLRSDSVIANYLMGVLCEKTGRNSEALRYFTHANGKYSSGTKEILFGIARSYFAEGNTDMALSICEQLLVRFPQSVDILELCARASYSLNDLEKTESYIVRILLQEPENTEYVLFRAKILMQKENFIRASSLLDVCARKKQTPKEYYLLRAKLQRDWNKNNSAAAETMAKAYGLYPDDLETMVLAAEVASVTGKSINGFSAMDIANRILARDRNNSKAMEICVAELYGAKNYQQAYSLSSKMIAVPEAEKSVFYTHIDICLALGKTTEANGIASRLYASHPEDEDVQMSYVKVLVASGQVSAAESIIARLLADANAKMKSFLHYERSFLQTTEDMVLADLRSSLTANPRNKDSLYRLYQIYYGKKDWRRAQYYLKQVIALDPANGTYVQQNSELERLLGR